MNLTQMRDNVRSITQGDTTDLTDSLLDIFIEEGWRHAAFWHKSWPFYRQTWTHAFTGDGSNAAISAADLLDTDSNDAADQARPGVPNSIQTVFDSTNKAKLKYVTVPEFNEYRYISTDTGSKPSIFTYEVGQFATSAVSGHGWDVNFNIRLWPTPASAVTFTLVIDGYREPLSFVSLNPGATSEPQNPYYNVAPGTAQPDMPVPFHQAILDWAIGQAFTFLDEPDRAIFFMTKADNVLRQQEDVWFSLPQTDEPLIMGGDGIAYSSRLPRRLRYDWEV